MKKYLLILICFISGVALHAQNKEKEKNLIFDDALLITPSFSSYVPASEMTHRFGWIQSFGIGADYKFGRNWTLGLDGNFLFGMKVKEEEVVRQMLTQNGQVVSTMGDLENIDLTMRGTLIKFNVGKIFNFSDSKPNNGLFIRFGVGYLMHKIIIDAKKDVVPQFSDDYLKGYDRMTHGVAFSQFIGLIKLERSKFINLYLGIEAVQGITSSARNWDFAAGKKLDGVRLDLMIGLRLGWIIPVFTGESSVAEYYYY